MLFFSFQRSMGIASCGERGNSSKCCTKTRITGSGKISATSWSLARKRLTILAMAFFKAVALITLGSTAEGTSAAGGKASTVNSSTELPFQRAAATRSGANSMAKCGCGMASSHRASRLNKPPWRGSWRSVAMLLNEGHLVDFFQRRDARADFRQAALAQRDHAFLAGDALDLRGGPAIHNHFADAVGKVQELADGRAAVKSSAGTFQAASAFNQRDSRPHPGIEAAFGQFLRRIFLGSFAVGADHAHQALGHDAIERGNKVIWLDAHIDEAADDVGNVVSVHGGENQVAGERGLDGDLRGFLVANFANHDLVGVVAQNVAQAAREGQSLFLINGNLRDAAKHVLDRIFDGDDFVFVGLDFVHGGVQGGCLAGAGWSGNQHHAVGLANIAAEAARFFRRKAHDVQIEALKFFRSEERRVGKECRSRWSPYH